MQDCIYFSKNVSLFLEFVTSMSHICYVYQYLYDNLRPVDMKKLMQANAVIFYPASTVVNENQLVAGRFVRRSDVWWSEETGLFDKYRHDIADDEQQPLFRVSLCMNVIDVQN